MTEWESLVLEGIPVSCSFLKASVTITPVVECLRSYAIRWHSRLQIRIPNGHLLAQLLDLNQQVAALITEDGIQPPGV
jgi:hypothetical protein